MSGARCPALSLRSALLGEPGVAAWTAVYSLQCEFGPLSEAAIGNVGQGRKPRCGWITWSRQSAPWLVVAEDGLDRFLVRWVEQRTTHPVWRAVLRLMFNSGRTLSNTVSGRVP